MSTIADSIEITINPEETPHFPEEGLCIGSLYSSDVKVFPAKIDLLASNSVCFLYNSAELKDASNRCLEKIAWRIALCLPVNLCELLVYNGGQPGENFSSLKKIDKSLFKSSQKVLFDADSEEFTKNLSNIYRELAIRRDAINNSGLDNLYELNKKEGDKARIKYMFVFVSDFPNVNDKQKELVYKILTARSMQVGVFVFLSWNMEAKVEERHDIQIDYGAILKQSTLLFPKNGRYYFKNSGHDNLLNKFELKLDSGFIDNNTLEKYNNAILSQVEKASKQNNLVILNQDFAHIESIPYEPVMSEISITVGLDIEDKHEVTLRFNSGDYLHAFILGQSGSGKSVLLNNIITSAMLKYSPDDLMLYLMDFKGVEFNRYRGVKHAKAVLVDNSDPQMTLEVLRELKKENARRVKLWRKEKVNKIDGYNRKHPDSRLPQVLFVADECQVMFQPAKNGTQRIIQSEIADILNIIATQGRSQGIHMLLATQQLDETDISGQVLKNLTECFLLMSAPSDSDRLVPNSSDITSKQPSGLACYYHKKQLQTQVQSFFAKDEELETAILLSQEKAASYKSNGAFYFSGSSAFSLEKEDLAEYADTGTPVALVGKNIGLSGESTAIFLRRDFLENILFFGANEKGQTTGVMLNALASLMYSYQQIGQHCDFLVIDCLQDAKNPYKKLLETWNDQGLCHLIERTKSGRTFAAIAEDIRNSCARPVVLTIIGSERFVEIKHNIPLVDKSMNKNDSIAGIETLGFDMDAIVDINSTSNPSHTGGPQTYPKALEYILEEGPIQGVHVLLQVDKPGNILFEGDFGINATDKFRHKVILKSENKFLIPMRFSVDIDVEQLSDEEERLRAYYYPEGAAPILFTPFQMPDKDILNSQNN